MPQSLLFSDPQPLVKRLGRQFFRRLPKRPGVYLMRDARENILYVGKAKNLRQRLNSYRIANPDRMSRRHLRLLNEVARIEWKLCRDEAGALAREAELLRSIRPKFNRAGVWPARAKYLLWHFNEMGLYLKTGESASEGWQCIGPIKGVRWLRLNLARLLWLATHAETGIRGLPAGWLNGKIEDEALIKTSIVGLPELMHSLNETGAQPLINWIRRETSGKLARFETAWLENELETLADFPLQTTGQTSPTTQRRNEQRLFAFA